MVHDVLLRKGELLPYYLMLSGAHPKQNSAIGLRVRLYSSAQNSSHKCLVLYKVYYDI
jgi:hypothetical protein